MRSKTQSIWLWSKKQLCRFIYMAVSIKIQTSHSYANLRFFMTFSWIKRSIRIESLPPTVPDDCRYVIARYIHNSNWETHTLKIISYTTHRSLLDFAQAHNLPYKCRKVEKSLKKCVADNATRGSFRHFLLKLWSRWDWCKIDEKLKIKLNVMAKNTKGIFQLAWIANEICLYGSHDYFIVFKL